MSSRQYISTCTSTFTWMTRGYDLLSGLFKRTAIQEMGHVELLAERILFLKGDAVMKAAGDVAPVQDVAAMLEMAQDGRGQRLQSVGHECSANADSVPKKVFEQLVPKRRRTTTNSTMNWTRWRSTASATWPAVYRTQQGLAAGSPVGD